MVLSAPHKSKILPRFAKKTAGHACGAPAACGARPRRAPRSKPPTTGRVRKRLPHARYSPSRTRDAAPCAVEVAVPHRPRSPMRRVPASARAAHSGKINGSWQDFQLMRPQVENLAAIPRENVHPASVGRSRTTPPMRPRARASCDRPSRGVAAAWRFFFRRLARFSTYAPIS